MTKAYMSVDRNFRATIHEGEPVMKLITTKSIKFGDTIIKEDCFGGQFVAAIRSTPDFKFECRISPAFLQTHPTVPQRTFESDSLGALVQEVEGHINS